MKYTTVIQLREISHYINFWFFNNKLTRIKLPFFSNTTLKLTEQKRKIYWLKVTAAVIVVYTTGIVKLLRLFYMISN